jgi:L-asparaginase II
MVRELKNLDLSGWDCPPLAALKRGDFVEAVHRGCLAVVGADGEPMAAVGDSELPTILRSAAKPFQLMAVLASGAAEKFDLSGEELAVAAASHNAEEEHLAAVRSLLEKIGLPESELRCGVHPPFAQHVAERMAKSGEGPSPISNNCSGKHASMLAACLARDWPTEGYDLPDHPLQLENLARMARFAGLDTADVPIVIDGCGVPAFVLPLWRLALAFARLADPRHAPEEDRELASRAWEVITSHPTYGSGAKGRLEAQLMKEGAGRLLAKVGAEGVYGVGIAPEDGSGGGYGLALKLAEGITFNRATDPIVVDALRQLGFIGPDNLRELAAFAPLEVRNCRGDLVGRMEILYKLQPPAQY